MSSEDREVYLMAEGEGADGWVSPTPAETAVVDALTAATDLSDDDVDDLDEYVDRDELRSLLDGAEGTLSFEVEGHEVTVEASGEVHVDE